MFGYTEVEEAAVYATVIPLLTDGKLYPLVGPPIKKMQGLEPRLQEEVVVLVSKKHDYTSTNF